MWLNVIYKADWCFATNSVSEVDEIDSDRNWFWTSIPLSLWDVFVFMKYGREGTCLILATLFNSVVCNQVLAWLIVVSVASHLQSNLLNCWLWGWSALLFVIQQLAVGSHCGGNFIRVYLVYEVFCCIVFLRFCLMWLRVIYKADWSFATNFESEDDEIDRLPPCHYSYEMLLLSCNYLWEAT